MKKIEQEIMDIDRAFCTLSQKQGHLGWHEYMSKSVLMGTKLHEPYIEGRDKLVKLMEFVYALEDIQFTWDPQHAFVSDDHSLAVTTGTYERTYKIEDKDIYEIGKYVTTWKQEKDGWKIIFDFGN